MHSIKTKLKISAALKRYASSPEARIKLRQARLGKRHSPLTIARIRKSNLHSHNLSQKGRKVLSDRMKNVHRMYKKYGSQSYFLYQRIQRILNSGLAPRPNVNPKFDREYEIYQRIQNEFGLG